MSRSISFTQHSLFQMAHRGLSRDEVRTVVKSPQQRITLGRGREVRQSMVCEPISGRTYLIRVVVETLEGEDRVVTAYRTSRLERYRGRP